MKMRTRLLIIKGMKLDSFFRDSRKLVQDQKGQGLTEYMILLVLVVICSIAVVEKFGKNIDSKMSQAAKEIGALNVSRGTSRD